MNIKKPDRAREINEAILNDSEIKLLNIKRTEGLSMITRKVILNQYVNIKTVCIDKIDHPLYLKYSDAIKHRIQLIKNNIESI